MRDQSSDGWQESITTVSLGDWSLAYLDYAKDKFSKGTYEEKKAVFLRFFGMVNPTTSTEQLNPAQAMQYSQIQMKERSG